MSDTPDSILSDAEGSMTKAVDYLKSELKGLRTGRASTALVEFVKVDYYGSPTDLHTLAAISTPEPTQILIKPFDATSVGAIKQGIEQAGLGLNPQVEDKAIRITIPPLDSDRRKQLAGQAKKMGEEQKVAIRNVRRDANKHADALTKQKEVHYPEDDISTLKDEIQDLLKKYEGQIDQSVKTKSAQIMEI
ncbi:MAG: ribosome recycling factor [Planctomycetota bacterium]